MKGFRLLLLIGLGLAASLTAVVALDAGVLGDSPRARPCVDPTSAAAPCPILPSLWKGETEGAPWDDEHFIQCQWDWACAAVEWACKSFFEKPPVFRCCTTEEYTQAHRRRPLAPRSPYAVQRTSPDTGEAPRASPAHFFEIGYCDKNTGRVFLHPAGIRDCLVGKEDEVPLSIEVTCLFLVHEATHALDYQHHPHLYEDVSRRHGGRSMLNTLLEGHAWQVTEAVSEAYGWERHHRTMLYVILGVSQRSKEGERTSDAMWAMAEDVRTAYTMGRRLFHAAAARGGHPVIEDLLSHPPRRETKGWDAWHAWLRTRQRRQADSP